MRSRTLSALVAGREIKERIRARSFQVSTLIAVLITAAVIILPSLSTNPLQSKVRVGLVNREQSDVDKSLGALKLGDQEAHVLYVHFADRADAVKALRTDDIHLAVIGKQEILLKEPIDPNDTSPKVRVARLLSIVPAFTRLPTPITSVLPKPEHERKDPSTAFFGTLLLYFFLFMYGSMILNGVAQEKGSRVIEVLLSSVPPRRLLTGKVAGIGVVALVQGALVAAAALIAFKFSGKNPLVGSTGGQILQIFGWFILAYAFYASLYAAVGATVSRQEEANNLQFPLSLPIIIAYGAASSALGGEDSRLLRILSFLPPTAPIAMPMRSALGFASGSQVAIAVGLTLLGTLVVIRLAGTIYERSILQIGARVRIRQALRRPA